MNVATDAYSSLPRIPALERYSVVELANGVAGAMAGMYLARFGAVVTRVVSAELGTTQTGWTAGEYHDVPPVAAAWLHEGKRTADLDLRADEGRRQLGELCARADLVVAQLTRDQRASVGIDYAALREAHPRLVVVGITPLGDTGPMADWPATEIVVDGLGTWLQHIGEPDRGPVKPPGHQSEVMGALAAVMAGISTLMLVERTGRGEFVDVALRDCVTWFQMNPTTVYEYSGSLAHRTGAASDVNYPQGIFECADGLVGVNVLYYVEWFRLCDLLNRPDWKDDPRLETPSLRFANRDLIDEALVPWLAARTADEVYAEGQRHRLPFAKVNRPIDLLASAQLNARQFWQRCPDDGGSRIVPSMPARFRN